jgi:predicted ester cyclase
MDSGAPVLVGPDIVEKGAKQFAASFPDSTGEAQLTLVNGNGNEVIGVWLLRGTNQGPLMTPTDELPATNKRIGFLMGHAVEVKGGKVERELLYSDSRTMLAQLGVIPGPARKVMDQGLSEKPIVFATNSESEKANAETLKRYFSALNAHDATAIEALLADDFVFSDQSTPADLVGKKEAQRGYKELFKAMSDARVESTKSWPAGDYVVSFTSFSGTNDGPLPSMKLWKKTGKRVSLSLLDIVKVQGGKLKNHWSFSNGMAFASQLGLIPPTKGGAKPQASTAQPSAMSKSTAGATSPKASGKTDAKKPTEASGPSPGKLDTTKSGPGAGQGAGPASPKATPPMKQAEPANPAPPAPAVPKAGAPAAPVAPAKPAPAPAK